MFPLLGLVVAMSAGCAMGLPKIAPSVPVAPFTLLVPNTLSPKQVVVDKMQRVERCLHGRFSRDPSSNYSDPLLISVEARVDSIPGAGIASATFFSTTVEFLLNQEASLISPPQTIELVTRFTSESSILLKSYGLRVENESNGRSELRKLEGEVKTCILEP